MNVMFSYCIPFGFISWQRPNIIPKKETKKNQLCKLLPLKLSKNKQHEITFINKIVRKIVIILEWTFFWKFTVTFDYNLFISDNSKKYARKIIENVILYENGRKFFFVTPTVLNITREKQIHPLFRRWLNGGLPTS